MTGFGLATVVVATYDRPKALRAVLGALAVQRDRRFEVIVAEDGSDDRCRAVVEESRGSLGVRLAHVWQEDRGFRLSRSRNRAVLEAEGDYLIFLDGDCIPRPGFVAAHRRLAEGGWFVRGTRAPLGREFTDRVLEDRIPVETWSFARWLMAAVQRNVKDPTPLLQVPIQAFRKRRPTRWKGAQTCNLGVYTSDFRAIDGFDEAYEGWGMDDADLAVRLFRHGVSRKEGKFATAVLHLWHPPTERPNLDANRRLFEETLRSERIRSRSGLSSHAGRQAPPCE